MKIIIEKKTNIYIYGAGKLGKAVARNLSMFNYNIKGLIDRNKEGGEICPPFYTYRMDDFEISDEDKTSSVCFIALADGLLHYDVAKKLYEKGFKYILFVPMSCPITKELKQEISKEYNNLLYLQNNISIDVYDFDSIGFFRPEPKILSDKKELSIVWVNAEIIFSEKLENIERANATRTGNDIPNMPIRAYIYYLQLFDVLDAKGEDLRCFWKSFVDISEEGKKKEIKSRSKLKAIYDAALNEGVSFFEDCAPVVFRGEENEQIKFNLTAGHHRISYLIQKGYTRVPVRMNLSDYDYWVNKEVFDPFKEFLKGKEIKCSTTPIPHPGFNALPSLREYYGRTLIEAIFNYVREIDFNYRSMLDLSPFEAYFSRSFSAYETIEKDFCLMDKDIYDWYYTDSAVFIEGFTQHVLNLLEYKQVKIINKEDVKKHDLVFAIGIDLSCIENKQRKELVNWLGGCTEHVMFWESYNMEEDRRMFIESHQFNNYRELRREVIEGRTYIMGAFEKEK